MLTKIVADNILLFVLLLSFWKNKMWHFTWIVCQFIFLAGQISFSWKNNKISLVCWLLNFPRKLNNIWLIEVLRPSQHIRVLLSQSVYLTTLSWAGLVLYAVHILLPETNICPSWISGRERMTVENISRSISMKESCRTQWVTCIRLSHRGWLNNIWLDSKWYIYIT